ncbi:MAG: hypothetical protein EU540_06320 [Promethearchaeota archaeon]|nr:MAG: hypothetical protein EU540_06320 [Candidatus Lokiarchaeota archaeon]
MVGLKLDDLKSWKRLSCIIALLGGMQFIIITIIAAIFFYPDGYSFTEDYISYLGTTVNVRTGSNNIISSILFAVTCLVVGLSLIFFWIVMTTIFDDDIITQIFSYLGSFLGYISSLLIMGVGIFPGNTHLSEHAFSATYFFLSFAGAIFFYSIAILLKKDYSNIYAIVGFVFSIIVGLIILRIFFQYNPIMQKVIVYGYILWAALQITKIWKIIDLENKDQ